ncbi:MAG: hypothetical protein WCK37_05100 [Candidatus Falkowbacteria bacterium]
MKTSDGKITRIQPGDMIIIYLQKLNCPVATVTRSSKPLFFESNGEEEKAFNGVPANYDSCKKIVNAICEFTGMQATEKENNVNLVAFKFNN